jgi:hypothetical protein
MLYVFATGLGVTSPQDVDTGQVFPGGSMNPLATPVDSILTAGTTANPVTVGLVPGTTGIYFVQFLLNSGLSSNKLTQMTIAQQAYVSNVVTFPVEVPGLATSLVITPSAISVVTGTPLSFSVSAVDAQGRLATSYTGTIQVTSNDAGATLPANMSLTAGTGTFDVTFSTIGYQTVSANDTSTTSIAGTSAAVNVTAANGTTGKKPSPSRIRPSAPPRR